MKSWLTQGSSGRRVTLLPGTTFLHTNGALELFDHSLYFDAVSSPVVKHTSPGIMGTRKSQRTISSRHLYDDFAWDSFPSLPDRSPLDLAGQAVLSSPKHATGPSASKEKKIKVLLPRDWRDHRGYRQLKLSPRHRTSQLASDFRRKQRHYKSSVFNWNFSSHSSSYKTSRLMEKKPTNSTDKNLFVISKPRKRSLLRKNGLTFSLQGSQRFFMNLLLLMFPRVMPSY